jgi:hypothetical protein
LIQWIYQNKGGEKTAISAGYQIQGINKNTNIAVKGIKGSISRPAQLVVGEYIAWHVWTTDVENALLLIWPHEGYGACFRYFVEGRYRDEIDWVDENADYDISAEIVPLQNDPSAYGSIIFYWRNKETGESKVRSYAFSQNQIAKAVDFALEFDDQIGTPQTTDWKRFYNAKIKRHGSNTWEDISENLFKWKESQASGLKNIHSEDFTDHKFWQRKEL